MTASYDRLYGPQLDFLRSGGYALLFCTACELYGIRLSLNPEAILFAQLRLALYVVLNEVPDALNVLGPDCSSWGVPARATSMRSYINAYGRLSNKWVATNNALVSRILGCTQPELGEYLVVHTNPVVLKRSGWCCCSLWH